MWRGKAGAWRGVERGCGGVAGGRQRVPVIRRPSACALAMAQARRVESLSIIWGKKWCITSPADCATGGMRGGGAARQGAGEAVARRWRPLRTGSLEMTPSPVQGASSSTRSKPPISFGYARPSALMTTALRTPSREMFACSALMRSLEKSLAIRVPVLPICAARCVVFPPGDAAMSSTRWPGSGCRAIDGRKEEADWIM